jgi:TonB family protein
MARLLHNISITTTTVCCFAFSAVAHAAAIGLLYYCNYDMDLSNRFSINAQRGSDWIATEFIPAQHEQWPEMPMLHNDSCMIVHPAEEELNNRSSQLVETAAITLNPIDAHSDESLAKRELPPIRSASQKQQPTKNGDAAKDHHKKVGPKQDFFAGQAGAVPSPPGVPDGKADCKGVIPKPQYPEPLWRAKIEGTVLVEIHVAPDGTFLKSQIRKSSGQPLFDSAAIEAVEKATRAKPAVKNGAPVESVEVVPFEFRLKQ